MDQARIERLEKKYSVSEEQLERMNVQKGKGPGRGPRGGRGPATGKPKDTKRTISRLLGYMSKDKWKLVIVFVCIIIYTVASLAGSYVLRPVVNDLTSGNGSVKKLLTSLLIMGLIYLTAIVFQYLQQRILVKVSQEAISRIREDLFHKIEKLPVRFYDTNNNGDVMSRFTNDVDTVGNMLNTTLVSLFSGVINIVGTLALMIYTNIWLTLITIVIIPVILKAAGFITKKSRRYYKGQQQSLGALNGFVEEIVSGQKVVKVFNHEDIAEEEFEYLNNDLCNKQIKAQFFGGIMGPVIGNISQVSYAVTAAVGGALCVLRGFDIGGLTIFVNYARQFSRPVNELAMQVSTIMSALAGAERVFAVMDEEPEQADSEFAVTIENRDGKSYYHVPEGNTKYAGFDGKEVLGGVALDHVTFGYNADKTVLKDISLYAKPGQKIAFVGSTGAGKTTITNLINRFYDVNEGTITIDGIDVMDIKRDDLRKNIAMVLQDTHLFTGTVRENIRYGRLDATDEEVEQAARLASAHSFIMRLEHGYDTVLEGDGTNLSQGQRQLLNIARAAISRAPILILDEATSSVDTRTEKHIEHGMDRLMAERTTLVIAHRLSTVRNANAIMVLEQGSIIERGDHEDLLAQQGRYYNLYTGLSELS